MLKDVKELGVCPDRASGNVAYSDVREQIICRDCGLIFEPLIPSEEQRFERTHGLLGEQRESSRVKSVAKKVKAKSRRR